MAPNSYRLPLIEITEIPAGSNQSETYRYLLGLALRAKAKPEAVEYAKLNSAMLRLPPAMKAQLDAMAAQYGMGPQAAFAGLCAAGLAIMKKQLREQAGLDEQTAADVRIPFDTQSDNQRRYYEQIMVGLAGGKIVFAEGSTGIGKSRAMAAAAIEMARAKKVPVIMAAPTVAVMEHLYNELCELKPVGVTYSILPGAAEFVDDLALRKYIATAQDDPELGSDPAVVDWVSRGAPVLRASDGKPPPLARALATLGIDAAWLMSDLRKLAANMPVDDFNMPVDTFALRRAKGRDDTADSQSRKLLAELQGHAKTSSDIVLCTHAMLAIGQRTQWNAVPAPCVVFIDEAHLFEQAVSGINSQQFSLFSLRASIARLLRAKGQGKGSSAAKAMKLATQLTHLLKQFDTDSNRCCLTSILPDEQGKLRDARALLDSLDKALSHAKPFDDLDNAANFRTAIKNIAAALAASAKNGAHASKETASNRVDLVFSPDKRYPSLYCGPARVDTQLAHIWKTAEGGVILASATLYIMDANGNNKCDYLRSLLAVDFKRISTPGPVIEKYIYALPTLYVPSARRQPYLIPSRPKQEPTVVEDWHKELALAIEQITSTAQGGTLVLFTAYKDIGAVSSRLKALGVDSDRIVNQEPNRKFNAYKQEFVDAHRKGKRPIMLALGAAWTGVDFKDDQEKTGEADTLLTDLVIARLPINLNKSNSMVARVERMKMYPIINECLLTFKQGIGRLIRRDNVRHRRLWILDGRPFADKWPGMETLASSVRRLLREYRQRKEF